MTKKQKDSVKKKIAGLRSLFGLTNWEIIYFWENKDKDEITATIKTEIDYKRISITIYPIFFEEDERAQSRIILHELAHFITARQIQIITDLREGILVTAREVESADEYVACSVSGVIESLIENGSTDYKKMLGL